MSGSEEAEYHLTLSSDTDASRVAREFVEQHSDSLARDVIDTAKLLVSEVVANAVKYGEPAITLRVSLDPPLIGVSVDDEGDDMPPTQVSRPAPTATSGRGLLIVASLSSHWGVVDHDPRPGKTVWFRLDPRTP
jgi:anti-sigma regulatory factor (Ser/Thr protein kinase)